MYNALQCLRAIFGQFLFNVLQIILKQEITYFPLAFEQFSPWRSHIFLPCIISRYHAANKMNLLEDILLDSIK